MSVENFLAHYPVDSVDLLASVDSYRDRRSFRSSSRVAVLARALTDEASVGLRSLMRRFSDSSLTFKPDDIMHLEMPEEQRIHVAEHHAAIVFGISVVALEDTLASCAFDAKSFTENYNTAISGTLFERGDVVGLDIVELSQDHMKKMYACVAQDKTFGRFFQDEGLGAMPALLRDVIVLSAGLPTMRAKIIPFFQERAQLLVAS